MLFDLNYIRLNSLSSHNHRFERFPEQFDNCTAFMSTEPSVVSGGSVSQQATQIGKTGQGHMHYCIITDGGNRLEAEDFSPVHNNTSWHTQYFSNTTNPLLFYDWNDWGFTYN